MLRELACSPWELELLCYDRTSVGMRIEEMILLLVSIALLLVGDVLRENNVSFADWLEKRSTPLRMAFFLVGIVALLMFGVYGPNYAVSDFIYFQF